MLNEESVRGVEIRYKISKEFKLVKERNMEEEKKVVEEKKEKVVEEEEEEANLKGKFSLGRRCTINKIMSNFSSK